MPRKIAFDSPPDGWSAADRIARYKSQWCKIMVDARRAAGLSEEELAARTGYKGKSAIQALAKGRNLPPEGAVLERMATALKLDGDARREFVEEAELARCPENIQALVRSLRARLVAAVAPERASRKR
jgi:transcriptional regulator with XRE-family HTH domain